MSSNLHAQGVKDVWEDCIDFAICHNRNNDCGLHSVGWYTYSNSDSNSNPIPPANSHFSSNPLPHASSKEFGSCGSSCFSD